MTPNSIIKAVRDRLGDGVQERWKDETLLLYVSLCQNDICIFTRFYRKQTTIPLNTHTLVYDLPSDCLAVNRTEYNCKVLPMESRNTIDRNEADYPCVLKDNIAFNKLEFVLDNDGSCGDTLEHYLISKYGVVTNSDTDANDTVSCDLVDDYGVVSEVDDARLPPACKDGSDLEIEVYYTAVPPVLSLLDMDNDIILPDIWFQAFLHFVCGMALQDDNDANNIQRGELEAQKYVRMLTRINEIAAKDFTSNIPSKLTTSVRRI